MSRKSKSDERSIKLHAQEENLYSIKGRKSWFLGIGINDYQKFSNLNNAVKDVKDLQNLLLDKYDLEPDCTTLLINEAATRENIIDQLDRLVDEIKTEDKLIIYFSGHGQLDKKIGRGYWIPHDAKKTGTASYIRNSTVRDYIKDIKSLHTLLISDSCFSGTLFVRGARRSTYALGELATLPSRWALCSGRHDEEVFDGPPGKNSPFAACILKILGRNQKKTFNVAKLVDRVLEQTRANYTQLPEGKPLFGVGDEGGQYIFQLKQDKALWQSEWEEIMHQPEDHAEAISDKLFVVLDYLERFPTAKNLTEANKLCNYLKQKQAFFLAKNSLLKLKKFAAKESPFQQEALKLIKIRKEALEETNIEEVQPEQKKREKFVDEDHDRRY